MKPTISWEEQVGITCRKIYGCINNLGLSTKLNIQMLVHKPPKPPLLPSTIQYNTIHVPATFNRAVYYYSHSLYFLSLSLSLFTFYVKEHVWNVSPQSLENCGSKTESDEFPLSWRLARSMNSASSRKCVSSIELQNRYIRLFLTTLPAFTHKSIQVRTWSRVLIGGLLEIFPLLCESRSGVDFTGGEVAKGFGPGEEPGDPVNFQSKDSGCERSVHWKKK